MESRRSVIVTTMLNTTAFAPLGNEWLRSTVLRFKGISHEDLLELEQKTRIQLRGVIGIPLESPMI